MRAKRNSKQAIYPVSPPRLPCFELDPKVWGERVLQHLIRCGADAIVLDQQGTQIAWAEHVKLPHSLEIGVIVVSEDGRSLAAPKHLEETAVRLFPWEVKAIARAKERRFQTTGRPETVWQLEINTEGLDP